MLVLAMSLVTHHAMCWQFPHSHLGRRCSREIPLFDCKTILDFTFYYMIFFTLAFIMAVLAVDLVGRLRKFVVRLPRHIQLGAIAIQFGNTEDVRAELDSAHDLLQAYKCAICHVEVADCVMIRCRHLATCMECTTTLQNSRLLQGGCEDQSCLSCAMRDPEHTHCLKCNLAGPYRKVYVG